VTFCWYSCSRFVSLVIVNKGEKKGKLFLVLVGVTEGATDCESVGDPVT
jgi:hypothetical protein